MKLLLVNPNTTVSMTEKAALAARQVAAFGTEIVARTPGEGPESIEGYYDEAFSIPGMLQEVRQAEQWGCAGIIVACFDDTGVDAARCIAKGPVVGLCEASLRMVSLLANSCSIVTTLNRSVPALEHLVHKYGMERHCRRVRASEVPVLALEDPHSDARERIRTEVLHALEEDGSEAIVLGCAGMVDLAKDLSEEFEVPVVDGVTAAVKLVEGLVALGLQTSKRNGYGLPRAKVYAGRFASDQP